MYALYPAQPKMIHNNCCWLFSLFVFGVSRFRKESMRKKTRRNLKRKNVERRNERKKTVQFVGIGSITQGDMTIAIFSLALANGTREKKTNLRKLNSTERHFILFDNYSDAKLNKRIWEGQRRLCGGTARATRTKKEELKQRNNKMFHFIKSQDMNMALTACDNYSEILTPCLFFLGIRFFWRFFCCFVRCMLSSEPKELRNYQYF